MLEALKKLLTDKGIELPENADKDAIMDILYSLLKLEEQKKIDNSEDTKPEETKTKETEPMGVS